MTAVAVALVAGTPTIVGDVIISDGDGNRVAAAGKIYEFGPNLAIGWSGMFLLAREALGRLKFLQGQVVSVSQVDAALDELEDLRRVGDRTLELIGWIVTPEGPKVLRWASHDDPVRFSEGGGFVGDGGHALLKMLAEPDVAGGTSGGDDLVPRKLITGFMEARFEETLQGSQWPKSWGGAYDAMIFRGGQFRWLPKVTYVGWDVTVDRQDRILGTTQTPIVLTQQRVPPYTHLFATRGGVATSTQVATIAVSYPIDADGFDPRRLAAQPWSVVSPYYANYVCFYCKGNPAGTMALTVCNARSDGFMRHAGSDPLDPRFALDSGLFQPVASKALRDLRAKRSPHAQRNREKALRRSRAGK